MKNRQIELKWALVYVFVFLLWMLGEKLTGLHDEHIDQHQTVTLFFFPLHILIYVLALLNKRKADFQGLMSYKQGLISGVVLSILIGLLSIPAQWVVSTLITPDFFDNAIAYSLEINYHETLEEAQEYFNLESYLLQSSVGSLITGIVLSSIISLFTKRKGSGGAE
jgi:hypothetical protein